MKITFGIDVTQTKRMGQPIPLEWHSEKTINSHFLILGDSGTGKTYTLRRLIHYMLKSAASGARFHVFDSHGDIIISESSSIMFSESTDFGFNPLEINPDPNFGGVRKRIQSFISAINRTSRKLGHKQEAVLRYILTDLYAANGFKVQEPKTWIIDNGNEVNQAVKDGRVYLDVPFEEKERAKTAGAQWDMETRCWFVMEGEHTGPLLRWGRKQFGKRCPTLLDALRFANQRLKAMFLGTNQLAVRYLEDVNRSAKSLRSKEIVAMRFGDTANISDKHTKEIDAAKTKAIEAYTDYVHAIKTGHELDEIIKYDSVDVLKSVVDRLENLNAIGIFRNTPPPFNQDAPVWRYDIKALNEDEKKLFVTFRLEAIFAKAVQRGVQKEIVEVVVIDESHLFVSDDPDHILNKLVKEGRKFGIALLLASQAPTHFSDDLISGVATKVILGLDSFYWDLAKRKLGINEASLKFIRPKQHMLVQMKKAGELQSTFDWVSLANRNAHAANKENRVCQY
jgi:hypothetical protein